MINRKTCRSIVIITALVMLMTVFMPFSEKMVPQVSAATETTLNKSATVTAGPLHVRTGPGTGYDSLGTLSEGKTFTAISKVVNSSGQTWYKLKHTSGKYGYVSATYVKLSSSSSYSETSLNWPATVKADVLNVRSGPSTDYSSIGKYTKGKQITVISKVKNSYGNYWYKVKYSSSKYGYVLSDHVTLNNKTASYERNMIVTYSTLTVRTGPGSGYTKLGTLTKDDIISVKKKVTKPNGGVWYQFTYKGKTAYAYSKGLKVTSIVSETSLNWPATVKADGLNVRSGPSTDYSSIGKYSKGKQITVISKVKNTYGNYWYKVKYSSSKYGYVLSDYVTLNNKTSEFERKMIVTGDYLTVRTGPDPEYTKLGTLKEGDAIYVKKKVTKPNGGVWFRFTYNGKTAYVYDSGLKRTAVVKETSMNKSAVVKSGTHIVRTGPTPAYRKLGTVSGGKKITIVAEALNTSGGKWYKFKYNSSTYGYIYSDNVTISGTSSRIGIVTTEPGVNLNVRTGAGTGYDKIGTVASGTYITILDSRSASNGVVWYKYQYSSSKTGWVCSDYVTVKKVTTTEYFENYMTKQGFPESYKPALRLLKSEHPDWVFKAYDVGCSWYAAVSAENSKPGLNVVSSSSPKSYRSKDSDCYNSKTGVWSTYDGGWYSAHTDVIRYYMDPRNFLNENGIYQFVTHKYDRSTQNVSTVKAVVKGTFLETRKPGNGWSGFPTLINKAGKEAGVNPNVLAAMIIQEQGPKGTSGSISGTVSGYKGYYNFLNIDAYAHSGRSAVINGLRSAKSRGWNTEYKSIYGGGKIYHDQYVEKNQYTFYTKKFNVMNGTSKIGTHQYMTNVQGAYGEALQLKKAFSEDYDDSLTFIIPVYDSMPSKACQLP